MSAHLFDICNQLAFQAENVAEPVSLSQEEHSLL